MTPILGIMASSISGSKSSTTAYESIATTTVGAGGTATITFSSIPATYTHLQLRWIGRSARTAVEDNFRITLNSDSGTNYTSHYLAGDGAAVYAGSEGASINAIRSGAQAAANAGASIFSAGVFDLLDYSTTTKYKTARTLTGYDNNGSGAIAFQSGLWMNTAAVSSITIVTSTGVNFNQHSSFALYGIKGA
jgi:hypothetical protein